jgi:pimeloyl-ACP methyl ester carboxylesterase
MTDTAPQTGYAPVNGLNMYYEVHGSGRPLVLLHGGFGTIETDFGRLLPNLAQTRQVIGVEQQAHGHTADVDRPLRYEQMADDVAALMAYLGIDNADAFGYSLGGNTALQVAIRHPGLVRKLALLSANYRRDGWPPEVYPIVESLTPEMLAGTPWQEAYLRVAPNPQDFPALVEKIKELDRTFVGWSDAAVRSIAAPTIVIIGDADHVRPEHAVEMFRLLGGGVPGDLVGVPPSQFAVLPGTTHVGAGGRTELLLAIVPPFLDAPMPEGR